MSDIFEIGSLLTHKQTGEWVIYAGAVDGEVAGIKYRRHMGLSLIDLRGSGKRSFASTDNALKQYRTVGRQEAHDTMQAVFEVITQKPVAKMVRKQHHIDKAIDKLARARDTHSPALVAQTMHDICGLMYGQGENMLLRYLKMFDETARVIAGWTQVVYGAPMDDTVEALKALRLTDATKTIFPYKATDVVLPKKKNDRAYKAKFAFAKSLLNNEDVRAVKDTEARFKKPAEFTVSEIKDYGHFSVEIDNEQEPAKYRLMSFDTNLSERAFKLLEILHDANGFLSHDEILERAPKGLFDKGLPSLRGAYGQLRTALRTVPEFLNKPFIMAPHGLGIRFVKLGESHNSHSLYAYNFQRATQEASFTATKRIDFAHFVVESDENRKHKIHRLEGTCHYLLPAQYNLLVYLFERQNKPVNPQEISNAGLFKGADNASATLKAIRIALSKAGVDKAYNFLQINDAGDLLFFSPDKTPKDYLIKRGGPRPKL